jgi:hypothetical protein
MQQKFTPINSKQFFFSEPVRGESVYPKKQTLIFIKQFARAYHAESALPLPLSMMLIN